MNDNYFAELEFDEQIVNGFNSSNDGTFVLKDKVLLIV